MSSNATLVGISEAIRALEEEIGHAARCDAKVLITGETGVGKEIVARLIHQRSRRTHGPMVTINCAGIPDTLLESEMFGHVKGSFTDAHRDKRGWLESAQAGTIFMDEVGEMSLRMQALLLRFLETGEVQRVGSDRRMPVIDVRVITATHRRLIDHVADNTFRGDLYYRLNVIHIEVPPLRERRDDVPVLLRYFLEGFAAAHRMPVPTVTREAMQCLVDYSWPGNVRELRNVAERLVLRPGNACVTPDTLPEELRRNSIVSATNHGEGGQATKSIPQTLFERVIKERASFWSEVYDPFMAHDLTRDDLRAVITLGLEYTRGNYKLLASTFNMPPEDYKKLLNFLRKYQCHIPFQQFRMMPSSMPRPASRAEIA